MDERSDRYLAGDGTRQLLEDHRKVASPSGVGEAEDIVTQLIGHCQPQVFADAGAGVRTPGLLGAGLRVFLEVQQQPGSRRRSAVPEPVNARAKLGNGQRFGGTHCGTSRGGTVEHHGRCGSAQLSGGCLMVRFDVRRAVDFELWRGRLGSRRGEGQTAILHGRSGRDDQRAEERSRIRNRARTLGHAAGVDLLDDGAQGRVLQRLLQGRRRFNHHPRQTRIPDTGAGVGFDIAVEHVVGRREQHAASQDEIVEVAIVGGIVGPDVEGERATGDVRDTDMLPGIQPWLTGARLALDVDGPLGCVDKNRVAGRSVDDNVRAAGPGNNEALFESGALRFDRNGPTALHCDTHSFSPLAPRVQSARFCRGALSQPRMQYLVIVGGIPFHPGFPFRPSWCFRAPIRPLAWTL